MHCSVEMLFVGTQSDLLAYNVEANSDVWFKDAADGVSTLCFGRVPSLPAPLALVGGNCSIQVSFCPPCPSYV